MRHVAPSCGCPTGIFAVFVIGTGGPTRPSVPTARLPPRPTLAKGEASSNGPGNKTGAGPPGAKAGGAGGAVQILIRECVAGGTGMVSRYVETTSSPCGAVGEVGTARSLFIHPAHRLLKPRVPF